MGEREIKDTLSPETRRLFRAWRVRAQCIPSRKRPLRDTAESMQAIQLQVADVEANTSQGKLARIFATGFDHVLVILDLDTRHRFVWESCVPVNLPLFHAV